MRLNIETIMRNIFSGKSILTNEYAKYEQSTEYIIDIKDFSNAMERCEKINDWRYETFNENGKSHSYDDLPAVINYYKDGELNSLYWCKDGENHRDGDEPANVNYDINGKITRIIYYKNGRVHRDKNRPADIAFYQDGNRKIENWYINGIIQKAVYYNKYGNVEEISDYTTK